MYKITLILPNTKEGIEHLEKRSAEVMADIICKKLNLGELGEFIKRMENEQS